MTTAMQEKLARKKAYAAALRTVKEIDEKFPTEEDCEEEINRRILRGKKCDCGCTKFIVEYGARTGYCRRCNRKIWITAGTIFEKMRSPRAYLVAIILLEKGIPFNSSQLHSLVGTAYSTALGIFKKIVSALIDAMAATGRSVSSFEFSEIICKRSKETEARKHPSTEQENLQQDSDTMDAQKTLDDYVESKILSILMPETETNSSTNQGAKKTDRKSTEQNFSSVKTLCTNAKVLYKLLSNQPISIDQLANKSGLDTQTVSVTLSILELAVLANCVVGSLFIRAKGAPRTVISSMLEEAETVDMVNEAINFIRCYFHGVSRKYLQLYLAALWCVADRARWRNGGLFKECARNRREGTIDLESYVSPSTVLLCAA